MYSCPIETGPTNRAHYNRTSATSCDLLRTPVCSDAHEFRCCVDAGCFVEKRAADTRVDDLLVVHVEIKKGGSEQQAEANEGNDDGPPQQTAIPEQRENDGRCGVAGWLQQALFVRTKLLLKRF